MLTDMPDVSTHLVAIGKELISTTGILHEDVISPLGSLGQKLLQERAISDEGFGANGKKREFEMDREEKHFASNQLAESPAFQCKTFANL